MPAAFVGGSSATFGPTAATSFNGGVNYTAVGGATHVLVLQASWPADPGTITTANWNGVAMTPFGGTFGVTGAIFTAFFFIVNPAAGANNVNLVWTNSTNLQGCVAEYSAVNITAPLANLNTATGTSTAPSVTVTTKPGDIAMGGMGANFSNVSSRNQIPIVGGDDATPVAFDYQYGLASGASVVCTWSTFGSAHWVATGVDIQANPLLFTLIGMASAEW